MHGWMHFITTMCLSKKETAFVYNPSSSKHSQNTIFQCRLYHIDSGSGMGGGGYGGSSPPYCKVYGAQPPHNVLCVPLLRVGNHLDFISNGKIMATGRQVRQIGIEEFFLLSRKNPKVDLSSDEAGCSPPSTESDSNSDQDSDPEPPSCTQAHGCCAIVTRWLHRLSPPNPDHVPPPLLLEVQRSCFLFTITS